MKSAEAQSVKAVTDQKRRFAMVTCAFEFRRKKLLIILVVTEIKRAVNEKNNTVQCGHHFIFDG